jgi:hypothetical protein
MDHLFYDIQANGELHSRKRKIGLQIVGECCQFPFTCFYLARRLLPEAEDYLEDAQYRQACRH